MKIIWGFFTALFFITFLSYLFIDPNFYSLESLYSGFAFKNRGMVSFFYSILILALCISYIGFIRLYRDKKLNNSQIISLISASCLILFFSYPAMLSYDIFNYLTTAKVLFHYVENPYLVMPVEFIGDPNLLFTHAANKYALYGPSWIVLSGIPYLLGVKNILLSILGFKILNSLFFFGTLYLLFKISKNLYPVILFGSNPLVLVETLLSNHNDIVLVFFAILSFYLLTKDKKIFSISSFIFSVFIKYASIFLTPVYIFLFIKKLKKGKINYDLIFKWSSYSMLLIFFLSSLREEIYPWYAIWFLPFAFLSKNKFLHGLSLVLSFSLLFRYVPYMYLGTHFGITPFFKVFITFVPLIIYFLSYPFLKNRLAFFKNE